MRKAKAIAVLLCVVVALAMILAPAAGASRPKAVSGEWTWVNTSAEFTDVGEGCQYVIGDEIGTWTGTFMGSSHDDFAGVVTPAQSLGGALTVVFKGKVGHVRGDLVMHMTWWAPVTSLFMDGTWTIVSTRGGLRHVRGQGTWTSLVDENQTPLSAASYTGTLWWE